MSKNFKSGNKEKQCDRAFDEYVRFGGMPGSYEYEEAQRYDYIGDVFRTVLIRDQAELLNITSFMMDNIADENTFEREYSPLLAIKDAYPKVIIARTRHETYQYEGIQVIDLARWCCHKN